MNLLPMLKLMEKVERSASSLYRWFSELFSEDEDAAFLFYRLSVEEDGHASLVRFIMRLASKTQMDGTDIELDLAQMEKAVEEMSHIQTLTKLSLRQAVEIAMELENQIFEYHGRQAVIQALPSIGSMVFSLGRLDQGHMTQLAEFARERGFIPSASGE
jgi:rubrerythrin